MFGPNRTGLVPTRPVGRDFQSLAANRRHDAPDEARIAPSRADQCRLRARLRRVQPNDLKSLDSIVFSLIPKAREDGSRVKARQRTCAPCHIFITAPDASAAADSDPDANHSAMPLIQRHFLNLGRALARGQTRLARCNISVHADARRMRIFRNFSRCFNRLLISTPKCTES